MDSQPTSLSDSGTEPASGRVALSRPAGQWLTQVLASFSIRCSLSDEQAFSGEWLVELAGAGFALLTAGDCLLSRPRRPPFALNRGDLVLWPRESGTTLYQAASPQQTSWETFGDPFGQARLISGQVEGPLPARDPFQGVLREPLVLRTEEQSASDLGRIAQCLASLSGTESGTDPLIRNRIAEALVLEALRQQLLSSHPAPPGWIGAIADPELGPVLDALLESPGRKWTLAMMAEYGAMSRSTFARRFSEATGMAPMDCLADLRMRSACERLRSDRPDLKMIARVTGYHSAAAFSAAFKRWSGITPSKFRNPATRSRPEHDLTAE